MCNKEEEIVLVRDFSDFFTKMLVALQFVVSGLGYYQSEVCSFWTAPVY